MKVCQRYILLFALSFMVFSFGFSQKVVVSKDINIRSDYAYDLIGPMNDRILLYRDRGFDHEINFFNDDLELLYTKQLSFVSRKVRLIGLVPQDTTFGIFYTFNHKGKRHVVLQNHDGGGNVIDTIGLIEEKKGFYRKTYKFTQSEDKSKSLIFALEKDGVDILVFDNVEKQILWKDLIDFSDYKIREDFRKIRISNKGDVFVLMEKNNSRYSKDKHFFEITHFPVNSNEVRSHFFDLKEWVSSDINMLYDDINNRVVVAGLYSEGNPDKAEGYFVVNKKVGELTRKEIVERFPFDVSLMEEVYGKRGDKKTNLSNLSLAKVSLRQDGGVLLMTEIQKQYSRRSGYGARRGFTNDYYGNQNWTDYENDDMVFISIHPDGQEHWTKVLYKKQFSQDDGGVFSSFFTFITPSRLRVIYNDQIKKNGTVSEYVLDPLGNYERNALMSTEDQSLLLRFMEAKQISSYELLVPSEKSGFLNLVKIRFGA